MRRLQSISALLLLLAAAGGLYQLAARFPAQWDATRNALNSLSPASAQVLAQLEGPLTITVYATGLDAQQGDVRKLVSEFIALYQRYKPDTRLVFIDPVKQPEATRQSGIRGNGELVVEFGGRREHLTTLNEQTLTSALLRLARGKAQLLMYVSGHGERKLDGAANHDLGEFGKRLEQNGRQCQSRPGRVQQTVGTERLPPRAAQSGHRAGSAGQRRRAGHHPAANKTVPR